MGKKFFILIEDADNNLKMKDILPLANVADSKDNIVVVLDTDKMMENNKFSLASNILYKSLFSPEAVKKINEMTVPLNFSMNPVDVYQIVKLKIQSLEHQILLSQILQKIIYSIVFILIYQYVQLYITLKQNEYVKKIILGLSKTYIAISSLKYFYDDYYNRYPIYISYDRSNRVAIYWSCFSTGFDVVNHNEF